MSDASVSEAEHREVEQYLAELEMLRGPAPGPELSCTPSCEPNPPLLFAPKSWKYCQVDPRPFCAYWERDAMRSTPFPLPSHKQMKLSRLARACHESIPGMWVSNMVEACAKGFLRLGCAQPPCTACVDILCGVWFRCLRMHACSLQRHTTAYSWQECDSGENSRRNSYAWRLSARDTHTSQPQSVADN
jgi:hypothetical protein